MKNVDDWLGFQLKESESFQNIILSQKLNDASGLGSALSKMVLRGKTERPSGVLLTGPSGSGKHNSAYHILQALDKEDCAPVFLTGAGLAEGAADFREVADRINALLDHFYDRGQGLCIVLEEPDECGFSGQLYPFLGRTAHEYRDNPDELPALFIIMIAKEAPALPSVLMDLMLCCVCSLPDIEKRRAFIFDRAKALKNYVDLGQLAEKTEGCSYSAVGQIVKRLEFFVDTTDRVPDSETIDRLVQQSAPRSLLEVNDPVASALGRLETIFTELSEKLSNISLGAAVSAPVSSIASDRVESVETALPSASVDRKAYEEMPVRQLSVELFGEEKASALLLN